MVFQSYNLDRFFCLNFFRKSEREDIEHFYQHGRDIDRRLDDSRSIQKSKHRAGGIHFKSCHFFHVNGPFHFQTGETGAKWNIFSCLPYFLRFMTKQIHFKIFFSCIIKQHLGYPLIFFCMFLFKNKRDMKENITKVFFSRTPLDRKKTG